MWGYSPAVILPPVHICQRTSVRLAWTPSARLLSLSNCADLPMGLSSNTHTEQHQHQAHSRNVAIFHKWHALAIESVSPHINQNCCIKGTTATNQNTCNNYCTPSTKRENLQPFSASERKHETWDPLRKWYSRMRKDMVMDNNTFSTFGKNKTISLSVPIVSLYCVK